MIILLLSLGHDCRCTQIWWLHWSGLHCACAVHWTQVLILSTQKFAVFRCYVNFSFSSLTGIQVTYHLTQPYILHDYNFQTFKPSIHRNTESNHYYTVPGTRALIVSRTSQRSIPISTLSYFSLKTIYKNVRDVFLIFRVLTSVCIHHSIPNHDLVRTGTRHLLPGTPGTGTRYYLSISHV